MTTRRNWVVENERGRRLGRRPLFILGLLRQYSVGAVMSESVEALVAGVGGDCDGSTADADGLHGVVRSGGAGEIILFAEALVDAAGYEGGGWAFDLV